MKPGPCKRPIILATDHFSHPPKFRTEYSEFYTPTIMRRWVEKARQNRRPKR